MLDKWKMIQKVMQLLQYEKGHIYGPVHERMKKKILVTNH